MIDPKDVTIVIPHLGGTPESEYALDECLKSLKETVPDIRVIVAKNGALCGAIHGHQDRIIVYKQGQCQAVNAAVATTNTPWIFVTNDDMIYAPGWWAKLTSFIGDYKCISPKLVEPRPGAPTFEVLEAGGAGGDFNKKLFLEYTLNRIGGGLMTGFNLPFLISRDLWDTVGGYDINHDPWIS